MRGGILAALVPVAAALLLTGGSPDAQPPAEAQDIDRALAEAERDLARAKAQAWQS